MSPLRQQGPLPRGTTADGHHRYSQTDGDPIGRVADRLVWIAAATDVS
jgi:hypothetical protein